LIWPDFCGPLVTRLTGFHSISEKNAVLLKVVSVTAIYSCRIAIK